MPSSNGLNIDANFAVVDPQGVILRMGRCDISLIAMQAFEDGETVISDLDEPSWGVVHAVFPPGLDDRLHCWAQGNWHDYPPRPGDWATWDGAAWTDPRTVEFHAETLAQARVDAVRQINAIRGATRTRFITALPGQDMVYLEKERLSLAWLADPDPDPADYAALMAEVGPGLTGETPFQVATIILHMADQWRGLSSIIEQVSIRYLNLAAGEPDIEQLRQMVGAYQEALAGAMAAVG